MKPCVRCANAETAKRKTEEPLDTTGEKTTSHKEHREHPLFFLPLSFCKKGISESVVGNTFVPAGHVNLMMFAVCRSTSQAFQQKMRTQRLFVVTSGGCYLTEKELRYRSVSFLYHEKTNPASCKPKSADCAMEWRVERIR